MSYTILGLLNLYHALEGQAHIQLVFVKHQEMSLYNKMWPNHITVGLPKACDNEGVGAARYFIKVCGHSINNNYSNTYQYGWEFTDLIIQVREQVSLNKVLWEIGA